MRSALPKVLHPVLGRPMVLYAVESARAVSDLTPVLVVGHGMEAVCQVIGDAATPVEQREQLGTGHATQQARATLEGQADEVMVIYGDMPLLTPQTLHRVIAARREHGAPLSILTVMTEDPRGFGRVVRSEAGRALRIVEEADASPEERAIRELNAAVYAFDAGWLWSHLPQLPLQDSGEVYLTDLVGIAADSGYPAVAVKAEDPVEVLVINTRVHLAEAEAALRWRVNRRWMESGVTIVDPATTYIETEVRIGQDTVIRPNTHLRGQTVVGTRCEIGPNSMIIGSRLGDDCRVVASFVEEAVMEDGSDAGPFSHLRRGAHLGAGAHVGNFGELKSATLGAGAKMGHFGYLGDAEVGERANVGAGTITCNFDGQQKHRTIIGKDAFIGSDTMLVAPIQVGEGAKTGAGSVVTRDVPDGALAYGTPARVRKERK